jgi:hypothetical protein
MAIEKLRSNDCISELFEEPGVVCTVETGGEEGLYRSIQAQVSFMRCVGAAA